MSVKFKAGDKVYYPLITGKILTLAENDEDTTYPLEIRYGSYHDTFTYEGKEFMDALTPTIFHATSENHELLSKLYPDLKFEAPPKRKTSKEIIQAMLDDRWKQIPCIVSDIKEIPVNLFSTDLLVKLELGDFPYICTGAHWRYAQPFDPRTGKTIIDYVDGEVILED